jgi:hypothetical protein
MKLIVPVLTVVGSTVAESVDALPNGTLAGVASATVSVPRWPLGVIVAVEPDRSPLACAMPGITTAVPSEATVAMTAIEITRRRARAGEGVMELQE